MEHRQELIDAALEVRQNAHAPYSNFFVGSAVLTDTGEIFRGANVENASYGLTICAERSAACAAASAGARRIVAVAVATSGGATPCGACRQFLSEFGGPIDVLLVDADNPTEVKETTLDTLLPGRFRLEKENP